MRVLVVSHVDRDPAAGSAACTLQLADEWRRMGIRVDDMYRDELPEVQLGKVSEDVRALRLVRLVSERAEDIDALIVTGPLGWAAFRAVKRAPKRPLLVSLTYGLEHADYEIQADEAVLGSAELSRLARLRWSVLLRPAVESSIRRADFFLAPRRRDTDRAVASGWKLADQVFATGWGVAEEVFDAARPARARWNGRIVWCGTTVDRKGWRYFRDGFIAAAGTMPKLTLDLIGTRLGREDLLRQFPPRVASRIRVFPVLERETQFRQMAEADAFVSTSLSEGYHLALQEAMGLGLPVIATAEGFVGDLPPAERPILEIPKRESQAVRAGIARLAHDAELRARLSEQGLGWAAGHRWADVAQCIITAVGERAAVFGKS